MVNVISGHMQPFVFGTDLEFQSPRSGCSTEALAALTKIAGYGLAVSDRTRFGIWFDAAVAAGCGTDIAILTNPSASTLLTLTEVRSVVTGDKISVWWDDLASNDYTLNSASNTTVTHTYASGANRVVVILNAPRITRITATVTASTAFGGFVNDFSGLTYLNVQGSNTISGSIAGLSSLTTLHVNGSNTISGSIAGLTALQYLYVTGSNTISAFDTLAAAATGLCYLKFNNAIDTATVNAVLAGFWANRDAAKPRNERTIDLDDNAGSGAPSGQGITDKAALQAYRSPNPPGTAALWTVSTK